MLLIQLLRNNILPSLDIQGANRKARRLMFKLVSRTTIILPKSLFISDVKAETMVAIGGFGRVFSGKYKGQEVALKVVDKGHADVGSFP